MTNITPDTNLRVLVVCRSESLHNQIDTMLSGYAGKYQSYWISQPELAPARVETLLPHIVLVDDDLGPQSMVTLIGQLAKRAPEIPMLALIDEQAIAEARQAVLAGAHAFVIKPLVAEDFWTTVRQVVDGQTTRSQLPPTRRLAARTVVFCAPKGGTGRTTMTVNTAINLLRRSGQSVALVDADFSAPALDVVLNLHEGRDIADLLSRLTDLDPELMARVLSPHASGLKVLLAPPPGTLATGIAPAQIEQVMGQLQQMFDWVVVDLGLPLDDTAFAFLDMADRIVMSVLPEMVGLRNTRLMLDQFQQRGYTDQKSWLVLNRASIRGGVGRRNIEQHLHIQVKQTIPDDQPLVSHSVNRGVPLTISHPRSAVSRSMAQLAESLKNEQPGLARAPDKENRVSNSLFQRLRFRSRPADAQ